MNWRRKGRQGNEMREGEMERAWDMGWVYIYRIWVRPID